MLQNKISSMSIRGNRLNAEFILQSNKKIVEFYNSQMKRKICQRLSLPKIPTLLSVKKINAFCTKFQFM